MMELILDSNEVKIGRMELGAWATNSYIIICSRTGNSALIDVPSGTRTILNNLEGTTLNYILLTHSHIDHVSGLEEIRKTLAAPLAVHSADKEESLPFAPEILLNDGDIIRVGKVDIEALYTPGHTPGSICFKVGEYLIAGDTLFPGGPGRTVGPSEFRQIIKSISEKIFILPEETRIFPGHGGPTTLKKEKTEFATFSSRHHEPHLCGDVTWLNS
jgi:hydroxyacylglutathione hydrolase